MEHSIEESMETEPKKELGRPPLTEERAAELLGYRWPASQLSRNEMRQLKLASAEFGRPITQLIEEAVQSYTRILARQAAAMAVLENVGLDKLDEESGDDSEISGG